ncbi:NADPH:quinone reductase [Vagococcus hydrophili]|uniref:NADPH:quinone reductase n=1 Tax=Vagococcus hydrophili TaxID=2714947 RepID=A0A6G8AUE9_9ENTE|nr:NADPH:quinone reductase [Vagococcus hydrophili]QIL48610.1 NADPH:quinone reductase [Vagococcus hydrophili]
MKGILVSEFGSSDVLNYTELQSVPVGDDEVRISLKAVGINPVETYIRQGTYSLLPELPYTPGKDGAGIIEEIGKNVTEFNVGDRVFVSVGGNKGRGTYAEEIICNTEFIYPLPDNLNFEEGAALGTAGMTAVHALHQKGKIKPGDYVLIHGATGGVGNLAVQLAKLHGAIVIATAGSIEGMTMLEKLGADFVLNHREENYLTVIDDITKNHGIDVIIEMLANVNLGKDLEVMALNGRVVIVGNRGEVTINPRLMMTKDVQVMGFISANMTQTERKENSHQLVAALKSGVRPVIEQIFSLEDAHKAQDFMMSERKTLGKIVLKVGE